MDIISTVGLWAATVLFVAIMSWFAAQSVDRQTNQSPVPWVAGYVVSLAATVVFGGHALYETFNDESIYGVLNRQGLHDVLLWITIVSGLIAIGSLVVLFVRPRWSTARRLGLLMGVFAFATVALSAFVWDGLI